MSQNFFLGPIFFLYEILKSFFEKMTKSYPFFVIT